MGGKGGVELHFWGNLSFEEGIGLVFLGVDC
jgi:hypothetical protein